VDSPRERLGAGIHHVDAATVEAVVRARPPATVRRCTTDGDLDAVLAHPPTPVSIDRISALEALAARVRRVRETVDRTRQRVRADAEARLASGTALAVHPETVRARADAVVRAREAVVEAERALARLQVERAAPSPVAATHQRPERRRGGRGAAALRVRRNRAVGSVVASFGLALLLLALDVLPLWAALLVPLAASVVALRLLGGGSGEGEEADGEDDGAPSSLLAEVDAFTGARPLDPAGERRRLEAQRTLAEEELRLAERAWHDLAGPDADVADLDAVLRRFDPQLDALEQVVAESVSVRAVASAAEQLGEAWRAAWAELGLPAPDPDGAALSTALQALTAGPTVVLGGTLAARAAEVVTHLPTATVLVVQDADEPAST